MNEIEKIKSHIKEIQSALNRVEALNPIRFSIGETVMILNSGSLAEVEYIHIKSEQGRKVIYYELSLTSDWYNADQIKSISPLIGVYQVTVVNYDRTAHLVVKALDEDSAKHIALSAIKERNPGEDWDAIEISECSQGSIICIIG